MRQKTIDAILAHAESCHPAECCGVIAQKGRVCGEVIISAQLKGRKKLALSLVWRGS
jgi:proteasome lid subunit RPN8/RPN11